ncbi:ABC transporter ATP-binding protein [Adlercreutzia sp. R25]|uniref:ABC transporter ATP-binding protein n=1 Tax=Adlercreutzia shanghongiae TaxID=3111773 RepID=UPI002DBBF0AA|nr:ABC transporter ATP-binding protein [Adlercreutzia sp. R25]MEC4271902.1 ABC transporter ATP-binding protein [Adlercreutzia sp. R25]
MTQTADTALALEHLSVTYRGHLAVRDITFSVRRGHILALAGESGAGKSTVLRAVTHLLGPGGAVSEGAVFLEGRDITHLPERAMATLRGGQIGFLFQDPISSLDPLARIKSQFDEVIAAHRGRIEGDADQFEHHLLRHMGFNDPDTVLRKYPWELSGGMAQRVALAFAMVARPAVLLTDEPTSALDDQSQDQVLSMLRHLADEHDVAVVMVTHDLAAAGKVADAVGVMEKGRLVESGPSDQVLAHPREDYTKGLIAALLPEPENWEVVDASHR